MLLEFSVGNYLSFKEKKTLNLVASSISENEKTNIINTDRLKILKGAVIYGANTSGKSNLIRAMSTMKRLIMHSFNQSSTKTLDLTPFLLSSTTEKKPSFFEVIIEISEVRYRYGFEITNKIIVAEWLYETKKNAEKLLFIRKEESIEISSKFKEGNNLEMKTRNNALFLSVVDQFNGLIAQKIMRWFSNFIVISGLSHEHYEMITFDLLTIPKTASKLNTFFDKMDFGFSDLQVVKKKFDQDEIPAEIPTALAKQMINDLEGTFHFNVKTKHVKYDKNNKIVGDVEFDMRRQESAGTNKVFNISGPIFDVLKDGGVLVIDELDSSLHPLITLALTKLFNSEKENSKKAQLIFTTHDTNLLSFGKYRRDQIYFIEKNIYGASDLYSLVEYIEERGNKIRKDRSFEKDYIEGRYGAIPYIGNILKI